MSRLCINTENCTPDTWLPIFRLSRNYSWCCAAGRAERERRGERLLAGWQRTRHRDGGNNHPYTDWSNNYWLVVLRMMMMVVVLEVLVLVVLVGVWYVLGIGMWSQAALVGRRHALYEYLWMAPKLVDKYCRYWLHRLCITNCFPLIKSKPRVLLACRGGTAIAIQHQTLLQSTTIVEVLRQTCMKVVRASAVLSRTPSQTRQPTNHFRLEEQKKWRNKNTWMKLNYLLCHVAYEGGGGCRHLSSEWL